VIWVLIEWQGKLYNHIRTYHFRLPVSGAQRGAGNLNSEGVLKFYLAAQLSVKAGEGEEHVKGI
jgi:hypothetical protein